MLQMVNCDIKTHRFGWPNYKKKPANIGLTGFFNKN